MSEKAALYRKIALIAAETGRIKASGKHQQGYKYTTMTDILSVVKKKMTEVGIVIIPNQADHQAFEVVSNNNKVGLGCHVTIAYEVCDTETGESITCLWQAQADSYGDVKALAKAQTTCLRTFLMQLFQIPAEEEQANQRATQQRAEPARPARREEPAPPAPPAPQMSAEKRNAIQTLVKLFGEQAHLGTPSKDTNLILNGLDIGDLGVLIKTNLAAVDRLSQERIIELYGDVLNIRPSEPLMDAIRRYTGTKAMTPNTFDGWRRIAEDIKARKEEATKKAGYQLSKEQDADIAAMEEKA